MSWIPDRYRELRSLLRPERIEDEVDEELLLHMELRAADLEAGGLSAQDAREEARRRFGDVGAFRDETVQIERGIRREQRRMEISDAVRREARQALRSLKRAPVFTAVAIITLGLGIGATTAIFTLIDSIVLRPLPYPEPDRLIEVAHSAPKVSEGDWGSSVASYFFYLDNNRSLEELGAYATTTYTLSGVGDAERIDGARVSASLLRLLGARPLHGRLISDEDDAPGAPPMAMLSYELWSSRFGSDPAVVGRTVTLSAESYTIAGVLEPGLQLPGHETRIWTALALDRSLEPVNWHYVGAYGRMRPGTTVEAATADIQRLTERLPVEFPGAYGGGFMEGSGFRASVSLVRDRVLGSIDRVLWMLFGAVGLVLLIACANVGNLLLVRAEARRREQSLRSALGAERAHLAVHYLTESLLLAIGASVLGAALAYAGVQILVTMAPPSVPRLDEIGVGWRSLAFAVSLAVVTGILFGLMPLLRTGGDFRELREGGRGSTPSRERQLVRSGLVVGQVGMALVLLAAGALVLQSLVNLHNVRSGIDPENVLTFNAYTPRSRYDDASITRFQRELTDRIAAIPGVTRVGGTTRVPLSTVGLNCSYTRAENAAVQVDDACLPTAHVLPGYFEAMGIGIIRGRSLTWTDVDSRTGAAVISRALADRLWPDEDPIGRGVISYQDGPPWYRIVGVADDVRSDGLASPPIEAIYYPTTAMAGAYVTDHPFPDITYTVKVAGMDATALEPVLRDIVRGMDPDVPLAGVRTMEEIINGSEQMARTSFMMLLLGIAAVMALFLSAVGLYGVIAYLTGRRRSEIGVRMALGARVGQVVGMIMGQSLTLAGLGVVVGVAGALVTTRTLESLLFEVEPGDVRILLLVSAVLLLVAVLASLVPAHRAARTDPSEALRAD
ncbi:MAG TPA: ABC transporter permease [Longimicrobiales bacterium]|nr:ABC transporter permease [Longimicrobiales bacterium]